MQNAEIITFLLSVSPLRAISRSVWSVSMTMFSNIRGYNILKTDIHNKVLRCWEGIDGKMNGHAHYPRWPCFYHITHGKLPSALCTIISSPIVKHIFHNYLITWCIMLVSAFSIVILLHWVKSLIWFSMKLTWNTLCHQYK